MSRVTDHTRTEKIGGDSIFIFVVIPDESHVLQPQAVEVDSQMSYVEEPIAIIDLQVRKLRSKEIPSVKVI